MPAASGHKLTKTAVERAPRPSLTWDGELRGFGLRVTAAGARSFIVQYRLGISRKQRRMVIGSYPTLTVDQARSMARISLAEVEKGNDPAGDRQTERAAKTFGDRVDHYLGDYARARSLKASTVHSARYVLEQHAIPTLRNRKIADVTARDIERLHAATKEKAGPHQANRLLAVMSRIFSLAQRDELRPTNPCKGVVKFATDERWRNFSEEEIVGILTACDALPDQGAANAVRLLLFTGARLQEVLKAEWSQIDVERGLWTKPSSHTKQNRQHIVYLAGPALEVVRTMRAADPDGRFVCPGRAARFDPKQPDLDLRRPRSDLNRSWEFIKKHAGLKDARRHDLRRTTASMMLDNAVPLTVIGGALGHTQVATTARYARLRPGAQREALKGAGERMVALAKAAS